MGITNFEGPLIVNGPSSNNAPGNQSTLPIVPESGPSLLFGGSGIYDPRYVYRKGAGTENNPLIAVGIGISGGYVVVDQAPSTASATILAALQVATSGTAFTLTSTTGSGITVTTSATAIPQTGNTVPSGAIALDGVPGLTYFGANKTIAVADPTKNLSRAVSVTGSTGCSGGAILVSGYDLYGYAQTEKITQPATSATTNGKKAFKFIKSVTPQFTDASHSYTVGTADIFGFPVLVNSFPYVDVGWAGAIIASSAGFTAAVSSVATNTTGDVRGTYAVQSSSNGVITMQQFISVSPANVSTIAGIFGVTPA